MFIDESEKVEVALGIANHAFEFVDLKKAEIAVVVLNPFLLQLAALLGRELVLLAALRGPDGAALVINQIGLAIVRTLAIGPAFHLHLQEAEVDPELQFFPAIEARNFADLDRAGFVRPIFQELFKSRLIARNNRVRVCFVNASADCNGGQRCADNARDGRGDRGVHSLPRGRARSLRKLSALDPALVRRICRLVRGSGNKSRARGRSACP